ncbi:MAG TPA: hypothetical protein VF649_12115 [Sphingomonas sp.]|uniref:hypothetical protein n=1 Tax=Sphingomonas sp. TaxID=28214 RepID=UPI002ED9366B
MIRDVRVVDTSRTRDVGTGPDAGVIVPVRNAAAILSCAMYSITDNPDATPRNKSDTMANANIWSMAASQLA